MTARIFKNQLDPTYSRVPSEDNCLHLAEAHVAYDREAAGYRAELRCPCRKVRLVSRKLHDSSAPAEHEGQAWLVKRTRDNSRPHRRGQRC